MEKQLFNPMEIDALGEMMNISLGSSATAVSNMLDHRVDITTPSVSVVEVATFSLGELEPAMGVEIKYVSGVQGSNIMLLRRSDIKVIVDILMGTETADDEFELNELTISAVCELMNQMMGAASTALSDFLGKAVNISTPQPFELTDLDNFKLEHFPQGADTVVVVRFALKIEGALESEFMNVMTVELARELLAGFGLGEDFFAEEDATPPPPPAPEPTPEPSPEPSGAKLSQEEIERLISGGGAPAPEPSPEPSGAKLSQEEIERLMSGAAPAPEPSPEPSGAKLSQEEIERLMSGAASEPQPAAPAPQPAAPAPQPAAQQIPPQAQMPQMPYPQPGQPGALPQGYMGYPPMYYPYPYPYPPEAQAQKAPEPKKINAQPMQMQPLDVEEVLGKEQAQNLDLIMEVPLQVTVEIGRTRRKVQDILEYAKGSLVVLDKLAGDQVDLFVNGKCIARGDVVVVDDNFGVRITEIVQKPTIEGITGL